MHRRRQRLVRPQSAPNSRSGQRPRPGHFEEGGPLIFGLRPSGPADTLVRTLLIFIGCGHDGPLTRAHLYLSTVTIRRLGRDRTGGGFFPAILRATPTNGNVARHARGGRGLFSQLITASSMARMRPALGSGSPKLNDRIAVGVQGDHCRSRLRRCR
jgi:hypothetical protein